MKQVPPTESDGIDSIRLEGTGRSVENNLSFILAVTLRKNNSHRLELHQGLGTGTVSYYPTFMPLTGSRGVSMLLLPSNGKTYLYTASGSGLFSTDTATIKGLKMGKCTLKARGDGFKFNVPGVVEMGQDRYFLVSEKKPSVVKIGKIRYLGVNPMDISTQVI